MQQRVVEYEQLQRLRGPNEEDEMLRAAINPDSVTPHPQDTEPQAGQDQAVKNPVVTEVDDVEVFLT